MVTYPQYEVIKPFGVLNKGFILIKAGQVYTLWNKGISAWLSCNLVENNEEFFKLIINEK